MKKKAIVLICGFVFILAGGIDAYAGKLLNESPEGYMVYVPEKALSGEKTSILICLPGWRMSAVQDINNWSFAAEKNDVIAVSLDIEYKNIKSGNDVKFIYERIERIIKHLSETYSVYEDDIFLAGTSAGGIMSISLALRYPDRFSYVGVVSGSRLGFGAENNLKNARKCQFYVIHGQQDETISVGECVQTMDLLKQKGAYVMSKVYEKGGHALPIRVYNEVVEWMQAQ
ncbi:MAG: prolyl oligopeptidase family serine peptidase [Candidatus Omnitrophota bacterium]